jgi:hypothetical protein
MARKQHHDTEHHSSDEGEKTQNATSARSQNGNKINPQAGSPKGAVHAPGSSLDQGGGDDPHDGRVHSGFTGDDAAHQPTASRASPASRTLGPDLGAQGDGHNHTMPVDSAERVTGSDSPNAGGIEGSPGGTQPEPGPIPSDDDPANTLADNPDDYNAQRKSQI